ncbi:hypothetical protein [Paenibacillus sp. FSL R7-0273]|uniref:hypothetical protein n=1 Tax=Paenibacillus sp. FSL R7-0273 TaxID=1536772 RepID=UPI0012E08B7F|nr:hypothetical protein [Paenibacillus sp. FSL R7-0273]
MKKEDISKAARALLPLIFILILTAVLNMTTFAIGVMERLVKESYKIGYMFGSLLEVII